MAEAPPRMRYGRPGGTTNEGQPASASGDDEHNDFSIESDEDRQLAQIEEWLIMTERRLERLDAKIDRLGGAIDQLNTQLAAVLTEMPTRKGINLYLVGGLIGAGMAAAGPKVIILGSVAFKAGHLSVTGILPIIAFIVIAPLLGMLGGTIFTLIILNAFRKLPYHKSSKVFKYLQLVSAAWYSLGHGTNDAQKMMGVISLALVCGGDCCRCCC
ncbi:MAG: inorganic phosphate transporter [Rhodospirillaceae bacterium]